MCILQCLGYCSKSYVRVLTQSNTLTIARGKAAKALKEKGDTPEELLRSIKENEAAVAEAQRVVDAWKAIVGEKARREEAAKAEAERKSAEERERAEAEEKTRIEVEKKEAEKKEAERIAAEKAEEEARVEAERKAEEKRKTEEKERKAKTDGDGQNGFNFFTGTINELIAATRKKGSSLIKKVLSAASNRLIADLKDKGVDISPEYNHTIDNNAINHALNRHSSDKEKEQGQIPLTEKDIENVNDVIDNYDEIKTEKNSRGQDIIIYKKRYTDGTTLYVEEVRTGRKELAMASMRKQRSRKLTDADDLKSTPSSDLPSASADKGSKKPEKTQEKQSVFDKAKEIADKEEKKRKAEAEDDSVLGQATRAVGKKKKVNLFKYTVSEKNSNSALRGVHYANGYAYASDGYILFKEKADYPKEWEGTTRDKDGNLIDGKYPDTEKAILRFVHIPDKEVESLPSKEVLDFAIAASKKLKVESIPVAIDGIFFNAVNLKKFLEAVASKGMDKVVYRHPMLYATNGKDEIVLMPTVNTLEGALDIADRMESAGLPKEQIDAWKAHIEAADKKMSFDDFKKAVENAKKEGVRPTEAEKPKEQPLTEAERKDAEEVAGALGYRVEWVDTMEENGTIDADRKVILIAKDAENPLVQVLGHEVAHGVRRMIGGKFRTLQKAAKEVVGEKEWNERIEKKRKLNAYAEGKLAEEVTCDIVGEALNNKDALKRLAESLRGERGILARLRDAVVRMVEYFKNRGDKEGVRRMKAADKLLAEFESALKEDVAPEQVKPEGVDHSVRSSKEMDEERLEIERKAKSDGTWLKAPNGKRTNLNERQWVDVRTKNFKEWFGDWENDPENASKIVDENGEPLMVFHYTWEDFTIFGEGKEIGASTFYNASDANYAATAAIGDWFTSESDLSDDMGKPMKVFLNIKNPSDGYSLEVLADEVGTEIRAKDYEAFDEDRDNTAPIIEAGKNYQEKLINKGYDGIFIADEEFGGTSYITLAPNQIKSAVENDGSYSPKKNDIRRSVREGRSEKTELTAEERELRDNLVERMRKGGLDVVTDSEEMQRVIDTENERTRNMFVGEKGATEADKAEEVSTRLDNLSVARRMEEAEKDAKAIKMATGWERGSDGKWRYETSDIKPKPFEEWMNKKNLKLGDIIDSDSGLFEMYPELKDFKVTRGKGKSTNAAIYTGLGKIEINFSKFKPYMSIPSNREKIDGILQRVINHEIQHAIQDSEGFAQGVSPNAFRPDAPIGKLREMEEADGRMVERYNAMSYTEKALGEGVRLKERILENRKEYNAHASKYRFGMDGYTRAAGEVEARNTEKRIGMTEEERRASLASETEDVAREDQILLGVDNADGEMNTGSVREHRVYHGSGADFDAFDHSHMGEGEGAQAYGWGTYVTEVEGIGRTYAIQNTTKHNDALRALQHDVDAISDQLNRQRDDLKYDEEQLKRANEWRAEAELDYELFKDEAEKLKEKYGEASPEYRNHLFNDIYTDEMKRAQSSVKSTEESIQYRKEKIAELEKALKDKQAEIDELPKEFPRHLYTVEIPDDNGSNYLDWNGHPAESLLKGVGSFLESNGFERVQDNPARYEKGESTVVLNPNATGADLYAELREALGSDKKASQALAELGCIGIKYPADNMRGGREDGAKNYVIFNENDAKITDHTRFLRTAGGEVYGLVKDGRIYLDPKVATSETAVHEYTHLWGDMLRRKDSEQWSHTVKELKNSVLWEEVKELYPELKTDDEIADEVLSTFSGRRGAERLREEARRVADGDGGVFTKAKAIETLERVKEAIARFWEGVARMFGINRYRSAEELADMAMKDLLDSKNPMKDESGMRKRGEVGETLATSGTYFSGGGLLEAGLKGVIDPKVAVEFSEKIAGVYADNHGNHIVVADVRDVDPKKLVGAVDGGEVQYFHASPVCKNFSKAKREGGEVELDKETALSTAEFIAKTRPKVVTIENVKGYRNSEALKIITDELTRQGYDWDADVYNTADYGGYTKRERLIVRAKRDGKLPPKPEKFPEELRKKGWYSAVEDLIPHLEEKKTGVPQGTDERLKNSGIDYRTIDKPLYVFGRGYANKTVGHAFADELLPTLTTGGGDIIIMPDGRVLKASPRVLARVTGLPDTYKMPETDQLSHTIVGNGIPTQLTEGVIAPLLDNAIPSAERATKRESVFDVADRVSQNLEERTRAMGSRVEKRMADVAQKLEGKELSMEQKAVVDVFSGEKDNQKFSVERNGVKQQFLLKQGQEDKAGAKHSLYRHYGTNTGVITADDVLKIPQVLERGERIEKAKGGKKMAVYTMDVDGAKFTVYTRIGKDYETIDDFYSNKKGSERYVLRNTDGVNNTPEGAHNPDSEPSAKVEDKSESPKLFGEEIIDDGKKGSDSIDPTLNRQLQNY